jgi:hypothetical protein
MMSRGWTPREWQHDVWRMAAHGLAISLLLCSPSFASWQIQEFLILYSYGWPAEQVPGRLTEFSAQRIAAAHYNTVMCSTPELSLVAKAGLRCLLIGWSQGPPDWIGESVSPVIAHKLAANPALWGYYVMDEPDNKNWKRGATFQQLAERINEYRVADPNHPSWINMNAATGSVLAEYMEVVKPDFLSYDMYRWWSQESYWWRGLEAHRDAALRAHVPLIVWIESNTSEKRANARLPPPDGNATKIRWSVYTSLAYGTKGIQWFLGTTDEDVANLNAELSVLGPTLVRLQSTNVFHTSEVPAEGRRLPDSSWYFTDAQELVIGEFVNPGEPNATYLMIANKSIEHAVDAVIEMRRRVVSYVEEVNKQSVGRKALSMERQAGMSRVRLHLSAGDGRLIRVEAH